MPKVLLILCGLFAPSLAFAAESGGLGAVLNPLWVAPFAGMLLTIALAPILVPRWWEHNRNQLLASALWSAPVLIYLVSLLSGAHGHEASHGLTHAVEEYFSFIVLLASLYVISGGILVRADLEAKPSVNTAFLAIGAVLANVIGTTGASMLLIRPLLRTNAERQFVRHVPIFFIFVVSNVGGALTPIGDPPLFLGYLRGVPFLWTAEHLWPSWLVAVGFLLVVFYAIDTYFYRQESRDDLSRDQSLIEPLSVEGKGNALLLLGVVAAVLLLSPEPGVEDIRSYYLREIAMIALAGVSLWRTPARVRKDNGYSSGPIFEVAALFIGIFITMVPATLILGARGASLGLEEPWQYFWATGLLSSFLDNAPTYATFAAMACSAVPECLTAEQLGPLTTSAIGQQLLVAISIGAVFMGANTYIGNGPNFMVRAIAEENGYKMPSFFGYMAWSALFLLPLFALTHLIFLR